eukprot:CAMPEP_0198112478 /NCGR_PEP_ID=MMETSP1442-20131203/4322_1 /TAXON_ID= /ORGANISM="Craspedostauros australis, Strain CCMP3328" /LENGTH=187 /DNA_ID=CAMNT_0043769255 /DNA_START=172 /DNA_END=735 /DNA_ORIENTATION=-
MEDAATTTTGANANANDNDDVKKPTMLKLRAKDGEILEIDANAAKLSTVLSDAMESGDDAIDCIDVPRVTSRSLKNDIAFLEMYNKTPMTEIKTPFPGKTFEDVVPQKEYSDFVNKENLSDEMLFELISDANFLGIEELLRLVICKITFILQAMNPEEMRQYLHLPKMTKEEEARAREEHDWMYADD